MDGWMENLFSLFVFIKLQFQLKEYYIALQSVRQDNTLSWIHVCCLCFNKHPSRCFLWYIKEYYWSYQSESHFPLARMLANLLLPLLLVACGQAQQPPDSSPGRSVAVDWPGMQTMAVDTAGACNCACAKTATVSVAYQTKYNACVGRGDRHRL